MIAQRHRPVRSLVLFGVLLIAAIVIGIAVAAHTFRDRELANSERELKNTALILSEQIDRSFQAIELVQNSVTQKIQSLGINAPLEPIGRRAMQIQFPRGAADRQRGEIRRLD